MRRGEVPREKDRVPWFPCLSRVMRTSSSSPGGMSPGLLTASPPFTHIAPAPSTRLESFLTPILTLEEWDLLALAIWDISIIEEPVLSPLGLFCSYLRQCLLFAHYCRSEVWGGVCDMIWWWILSALNCHNCRYTAVLTLAGWPLRDCLTLLLRPPHCQQNTNRDEPQPGAAGT